MEEVMEVEVEEVMEVAVAVAIQTSTSMAEDLLTPLEVRGKLQLQFQWMTENRMMIFCSMKYFTFFIITAQ